MADKKLKPNLLGSKGNSLKEKYPEAKPEGDGKQYPPPTPAQSDAIAAGQLMAMFGETIESAKKIKPSKPK